MSLEKDSQAKTAKIPDDVIAICAANAVLRTPGVADLSSGFSDTISKNILGKDPLYTGIKVSQSEEGASLDVYVIVKFGVNIPEVSWEIQGNVKLSVTDITDIPVKAVNIHIQGVSSLDDSEEEDNK